MIEYLGGDAGLVDLRSDDTKEQDDRVHRAVAAERERCAHIAEHYAQANIRWDGGDAAEAIARLIRAGTC